MLYTRYTMNIRVFFQWEELRADAEVVAVAALKDAAALAFVTCAEVSMGHPQGRWMVFWKLPMDDGWG